MPTSRVYTNKDLKQSNSYHPPDVLDDDIGSPPDVLDNETAPVADNDELNFQDWYKQQSRDYNLNPNPEGQFYDYRAAMAENAQPDETGHWPSKFKQPGHPNEFVGGFSTITGEPNRNQRQETDINKLVAQGYDPETAKQLIDKNTYKGPSSFSEGVMNSLTSGEAAGAGLRGLGGFLKGAVLDIPETMIEGVKSTGNLLKDLAGYGGMSPVDAITSRIGQIPEMVRGIDRVANEAGSNPDAFGRMMGQMTGQPAATYGIGKAIPPTIRGAGHIVEPVGRVMRKYTPLTGMPIVSPLAGRNLQRIERMAGKGIESVGKKMKDVGRVKVVDGKIVDPADLPLERGQVIPDGAEEIVMPRPSQTSPLENTSQPRSIRERIREIEGLPDEAAPEVQPLMEGQELRPTKPKFRLNPDKTFTDMNTGEMFDAKGKPLAVPPEPKILTPDEEFMMDWYKKAGMDDIKDVTPTNPNLIEGENIAPTPKQIDKNSSFFKKNQPVKSSDPKIRLQQLVDKDVNGTLTAVELEEARELTKILHTNQF